MLEDTIVALATPPGKAGVAIVRVSGKLSHQILKTIIKNRVHRIISLKIKLRGNEGVISQCFYCDKKYKRQQHYVTPYSLNTISFEYSKKNILKIVNEELNCNFTDVIITEDSTLNIDENLIPVCGSI